MPPLPEWIVAGGLAIAFLLVIALAEMWRWLAKPSPESTRKLIHCGGGAICLALPFLFTSHWVVLALAAGMVLLFAAARFGRFLPSLHSVERKTHGTEYYPLVVYVIFTLTRGQVWKYLICVLVLAVSDALAALIGSRYGRIRYSVDEDQKSLEGSLVFLVVTFLVVQLPLLIWDDVRPDAAIPGPVNCILASLLVAMLVTGFEAVSQHGRDNLWVPLGTYVALTKILRQPQGEIVVQLTSLAAICLVVSFAAWWSHAFNVGATIVLILFAYGTWSLGSLDWALPVFLGLAVYIAAAVASREPSVVRVRALVRSLLPPFVVLGLANFLWTQSDPSAYRFWFGPYLAGGTLVLIRSLWTQVQWDNRLTSLKRYAGIIALAVFCTALVSVPAWLMQRASGVPPVSMLWMLAVSMPLALLTDWQMGAPPPPTEEDRRWCFARLLLTVSGISALAALQTSGLAPIWHPK
ncbi:MAG: hypothetical protein HYS13_13660 [Planctomycetia bacterium]|nr:hypothetical protein [Planctomycetia bacterium]